MEPFSFLGLNADLLQIKINIQIHKEKALQKRIKNAIAEIASAHVEEATMFHTDVKECFDEPISVLDRIQKQNTLRRQCC